jgi:hypothetical protein
MNRINIGTSIYTITDFIEYLKPSIVVVGRKLQCTIKQIPFEILFKLMYNREELDDEYKTKILKFVFKKRINGVCNKDMKHTNRLVGSEDMRRVIASFL